MTEPEIDRRWPREVLDPAKAERLYPAAWKRAWELSSNYPTSEALRRALVAKVVSMLVDTCCVCHAANAACRCWDKEGA